MKTYFYIGAAVAAALSCSAVNAQVLGGNVAGGLGGAASGGLRDMSVIGQGHGSGAFGADLGTGSRIGTLRDTTSDVTGRVRNRTRDTAENVRDRTGSAIGNVKGKGEAVASVTSDAVTTVRQTEAPQVDAMSSLNSAANLTSDGATGSLDTAHQAQAISSPVSAPEVDSPAQTPAQPVSEPQPMKSIKQAEVATSGGASGNANASKQGMNASADANGAASASVQR